MVVKLEATTFLPTKFGEFKVFAFTDSSWYEHLALVKGVIKEGEKIPVRIHSKCLTGDTFASLRCDCRDQLEAALNFIEKNGVGVLIYLDQEGRGIGLTNKIKAYALQENGADTVEANKMLGFPEDLREYKVAIEILKNLGVKRICLITNNPKKLESVETNGIEIVERIPLVVKTNKHNKRYMQTKKEKMQHMIE